jgi:TRAP-type C4-dicarboxylate transport system permease small subunit
VKKVARIINEICLAASYVGGVVLMGIMCLTMVEVISRYLLNHPLILCDEFGGYSLVVLTFLGLAYCWRDRGHIRISFVVNKLPPKLSGYIRVVTLILALVYVALATKVSWSFLAGSFQRDMRSNSWLMTPLKWPQAAIPIGFSLLLMILVIEVVRAFHLIKAGSVAEIEEGEE